ncbi:MAG: family 20 glycosylhydrolase [Paludibacteraceae bacterium]|nr:family 20 glycosylhydrolase [Paludibacteraceae bacterium]
MNSEKQGVLSLHWRLVANDITMDGQRGLTESELTLTNYTDHTITADGNWLIGYCWSSTHPFHYEGEQLSETEVCATYHTLKPTADFLPLEPGQSRTFRLLQHGAIIRQSAGPEGAFYVAGPDAKPMPIPVTGEPFTSPAQWTRNNGIAYADGTWLYNYNQPYCTSLTDEDFRLRPLHIMPQPKHVNCLKGKANLAAPVRYLHDANLPEEGYVLTLQPRQITVTSSTPTGRFYAEQTLERLRENNEPLPAMTITDAPDLPHRGLMLDIARNFTPKEEIMRMLDAMAAYKMNVLHFHIVDDEAWRIEIPDLPELTEVGSRRGYTTDESQCLYPAYCGGGDAEAVTTANGYLTRADYIEIVTHAQQHHIRVIPEIEMPGHARAAIRAMEARYHRLLDTDPVAAEAYRLIDPNDTSHYSSAQYYTDNVLCIARPSTYRFVEKIITELAAMHLEAGQPMQVVHVGGDEVANGAWLGSPMCQAFMAEKGMTDTHELKDYFLQQILAFLRPMGIQLAGWEDVVMRGNAVNPRFADDRVLSWCWNSIPEWQGDEKPYRLANAGYPVVLACVGNLYIDMSYTNHQEERGLHWGGYTDEHSTFDFLPFDIYRSVRYTMRRQPRDLEAYALSKAPDVNLLPEARKNIHGINGQLFSETIRSTQQLEEYIFPKLQGLAERGWNATPVSLLNKTQKTDVASDKSHWFETERLVFSHQLYRYELPRLSRWGISFHLPQPGIRIAEANVEINSPISGADVHYTTDGSQPTLLSPRYQKPFPYTPGCTIRATVYYLNKQSNTTILMPQD